MPSVLPKMPAKPASVLTTAAGVIVVLNKRKPAARKDRIVLLNASKAFRKGRPKNYLPEESIRPLAAAYLKGEAIDGEVAVVTREQIVETDYNLSPSRWAGQASTVQHGSVASILRELADLDRESQQLTATLSSLLAGVADD